MISIRAAIARMPPPGTPRLELIGDEVDGKYKRLPRVDRLALQVAGEVLRGVDTTGLALVVGTHYGGLSATVDFLEGLAKRGPAFGSPTAFHESVHHAPAGQLALAFKLTGQSLTISARELSGETALKAAVDLIALGRAKRVLVVACEEWAPLLDAAFAAFSSEHRPGEGAAALLLEEGPGAVVLDEIALDSTPAPTLRFAPDARAPVTLNPIEGIARVVRAFEALGPAAPGASRTIDTYSMGGSSALIRLSRT